MVLSELLAGWRKQWTADGLVLLPPGNDETTVVRVRERQQPLRSFRAIVDDLIDHAGSDFKRHASFGALTLFPTAEGEHAGIITMSSRAPTGDSVERTVALVAGDAFFTTIDGLTSDAARFDVSRELVRALAQHHYLGLGQLRSRRYYYEAPPQWEPVPRPRSVRWFHPRYPQHPGMIEVHQARPLQRTTSDAVDRMLNVDPSFLVSVDPQRPLERITNLANLGGYLRQITGMTATGQPMTVLQVILSDDRFLYITNLETTTETLEACLPAFRRVVATIDAVPHPKAGFESDASAFIHWSD